VLLPVDTAGRILELILMLESVSTRKEFLFYSLSQFIPKCTCVSWHQILLFAVLGGWKLELSYILSYICCIQHYWLREKFPWVDEWFHSEVLWTNSWKYISSEVSCVFLDLYWEQDIYMSIEFLFLGTLRCLFIV